MLGVLDEKITEEHSREFEKESVRGWWSSVACISSTASSLLVSLSDRSLSSKLARLVDVACGSGVSRGNVRGFKNSGRGAELFRHHQSPISSALSLPFFFFFFFAQSELSVIWLQAGLIGQSEWFVWWNWVRGCCSQREERNGGILVVPADFQPSLHLSRPHSHSLFFLTTGLCECRAAEAEILGFCAQSHLRDHADSSGAQWWWIIFNISFFSNPCSNRTEFNSEQSLTSRRLRLYADSSHNHKNTILRYIDIFF